MLLTNKNNYGNGDRTEILSTLHMLLIFYPYSIAFLTLHILLTNLWNRQSFFAIKFLSTLHMLLINKSFIILLCLGSFFQPYIYYLQTRYNFIFKSNITKLSTLHMLFTNLGKAITFMKHLKCFQLYICYLQTRLDYLELFQQNFFNFTYITYKHRRRVINSFREMLSTLHIS